LFVYFLSKLPYFLSAHVYFLSTAALQSVFPQAELGPFLVLSREDKEQQLAELSAVVTGIRLFNKFLKKGGEGIDDREFNLPHAAGIQDEEDFRWGSVG